MNELMFKAFGQKYMDAAGDAGGEGGGGGSAAGAGAAGAAADGGNAGGEGGGEGGALTGSGDAGGAGSAAGAGEGGSGSSAGGNGEGGDGGALTGQGDTPEAIDWENLTDEDYVKKLVAPDGQKFNDEVMKAYAPLLRENKIDPKVFQQFLAKDAELQKSFGERRKAEVDAAQAEAKKAFKQAGEDFRKEFTPEQVREMNTVLAGIEDQTFKTLVTKSPLANNKTIGKMLLAYKKVYGEDSLPTGGTGGQEKTFEQVWTGK